MKIFNLTLSQMLMMFFLMAIGFTLKRCKILPENSDKTISKLETFLFVPALSLYSQMTKCNIKSFSENSPIMLYALVTIVCSIALAYPLSALFVKNKEKSHVLAYQRNIYKYALSFGNYGFMGNFIILGVWGEDMFFKYGLYSFVLGLFCYSWGLCVLIPKDQNAGIWKNLRKGLLTPPLIGLVAGIIIGLFGLTKYFPDFFMSAIDNAGKCQGPAAMVLAGIVIGGYNFKDLICNKKVYVASFFRLIVIPAVIMLILHALDTSKEIMILTLIAFATPLGLNTIVYPATYGGDTKPGASMAMISHVLSVVTIPIMYLLFIEMM